ncbi:hypothetical protein GQ457_15G027140 [Hibiscus cannabinus]
MMGMGRVVAQSALLTTHGHGPSKESENQKRSVKMAPPLLRRRSGSIYLDDKTVRFGPPMCSVQVRGLHRGSNYACPRGIEDYIEGEHILLGILGKGTGIVAKALKTSEEAKFEGFTEEAAEAIMLARDESRRLGHNYIGSEQILLGLIAEATGIAAQVVKSMGIKLEDARKQVENICPRGRLCSAVGFPFTSLATTALLYSFDEARKRGRNHIGPEHLLLGVLRQRVVRGVFKDLGTDSSNVYTQVIRMVGEGDEIKSLAMEKLNRCFVPIMNRVDEARSERNSASCHRKVSREGGGRRIRFELRSLAIGLLEDNIAEKIIAREIKEGDSVTVDADSDGNVVVLNGSIGAH